MTTTYNNEESSKYNEAFESAFEGNSIIQMLGNFAELTKSLINGNVQIEDVIRLILKNDNLRVDRENYLSAAFMKECDKETIEKAISTTPAKAGISKELVDKIAKEAIKKQTNEAFGLSVLLGSFPGGAAVDVATTGMDMVQYYGRLLLLAQKLLYLYGFPEIDLESDKNLQIDDGTMNMLLISLAAMLSIDKAGPVLKNMAEMLAAGVEQKMMKQALTKSAIWPVMSSILSYFSINLTKELACKTVANGIKIVGGLLVGGITWASFRTCGERLRETICDTALSNPGELQPEMEIIDVEAMTPETISFQLCPAFEN